jgi:hypothetical protein
MCDKERLVAYVYDEMSADERSRFERHLAECAECREEIADLRSARVHLAAWRPPELDVDFQIVRHTRPGWRGWWSPAWGLAAAAALVLAAAAAIANVQVRYDRDGVTVRTGWRHDAAAPAAASSAARNASAADAALAARYAEMERRLRQLETAAARPAPAPASSTPAAGMSDAEVLRRMRALVADSETRQNREMAIRVAQMMTDVNRQRQADLVRIANSVGRLESLTTADQLQHRQDKQVIMDAMMRLSQQR